MVKPKLRVAKAELTPKPLVCSYGTPWEDHFSVEHYPGYGTGEGCHGCAAGAAQVALPLEPEKDDNTTARRRGKGESGGDVLR